MRYLCMMVLILSFKTLSRNFTSTAALGPISSPLFVLLLLVTVLVISELFVIILQH